MLYNNAAESYPFFPGKATRIHWGFPDPAAVADETERMESFRHVRDAIEVQLREWLNPTA
jgi:arsenate reductase